MRYVENKGTSWNFPQISRKPISDHFAFDLAGNSLSGFDAFKESVSSSFYGSGTASAIKFARDFYNERTKEYDKNSYISPEQIKKDYGLDVQKAMPLSVVKDHYESKLDYDYSNRMLAEYTKEKGWGVPILGGFLGMGVSSFPLFAVSWLGALRYGAYLSTLMKTINAQKKIAILGIGLHEGAVSGLDGMLRESYKAYRGLENQYDASGILFEAVFGGFISAGIGMFAVNSWFKQTNKIKKAIERPVYPLFRESLDEGLKAKANKFAEDWRDFRDFMFESEVRKNTVFNAILATPVDDLNKTLLSFDPLDIQTAKIILESPNASIYTPYGSPKFLPKSPEPKLLPPSAKKTHLTPPPGRSSVKDPIIGFPSKDKVFEPTVKVSGGFIDEFKVDVSRGNIQVEKPVKVKAEQFKNDGVIHFDLKKKKEKKFELKKFLKSRFGKYEKVKSKSEQPEKVYVEAREGDEGVKQLTEDGLRKYEEPEFRDKSLKAKDDLEQSKSIEKKYEEVKEWEDVSFEKRAEGKPVYVDDRIKYVEDEFRQAKEIDETIPEKAYVEVRKGDETFTKGGPVSHLRYTEDEFLQAKMKAQSKGNKDASKFIKAEFRDLKSGVSKKVKIEKEVGSAYDGVIADMFTGLFRKDASDSVSKLVSLQEHFIEFEWDSLINRAVELINPLPEFTSKARARIEKMFKPYKEALDEKAFVRRLERQWIKAPKDEITHATTESAIYIGHYVENHFKDVAKYYFNKMKGRRYRWRKQGISEEGIKVLEQELFATMKVIEEQRISPGVAGWIREFLERPEPASHIVLKDKYPELYQAVEEFLRRRRR